MDERRKWPRFVPHGTVATIVDEAGGEQLATVLNESLGGAAFACAAGGQAPMPGTMVSIRLREVAVPAIVWHSRCQSDGTIVFGVEWLDQAGQPEHR